MLLFVGQKSTHLIRWMGHHGFNFKEVKFALREAGVAVADATIMRHMDDVEKGRNSIPRLNKERRQFLREQRVLAVDLPKIPGKKLLEKKPDSRRDFGLFRAAPPRLQPPTSKDRKPKPITDWIGVVSCGKKKRRTPCVARSLYHGFYTEAQIRWCDALFESWVVLSAEHGVVMPDEVISPYDCELKTMTNEARRMWGTKARKQLLKLGNRFVFVGAGLYWDWIECVPVRPMSISLPRNKSTVIRDMAACGYDYPSIVAFFDSCIVQRSEGSYRQQIAIGQKEEPQHLYDYKPFKKTNMTVQKPLEEVNGLFTKTQWFYMSHDWRPE